MLRVQKLTIDAHDPDALADWWSEALGWARTDVDEDEVLIRAPVGEATGVATILFLRAPDTKSQKNRLHLDLVSDDQGAAVARLESLGATRADIGQGDATWVVLSDPEGNEFCVLRGRAAG